MNSITKKDRTSENCWRTWAEENKVFDKHEKKRTLLRTQTIAMDFIEGKPMPAKPPSVDQVERRESAVQMDFNQALMSLFPQL